jgi:phosphoribosylformylglycinamidine cyclo-ligase
MKDEASTYAASGVNYEPLDRFKRLCQLTARSTASCLTGHGLTEPEGIRGESAYLFETDGGYLAHVEEGLGTKNLVADEMIRLRGGHYYQNIGIDTVAAIVNDMITVGALPLSVAMHAAVGNTSWFDQEERSQDLVDGFAEGCRLAGSVWGGGESPVLPGVVGPSGIVLAGSAVGRVAPKGNRISGDVRPGNLIIFLRSSGVHANGITLCRSIASRLPDGYLTQISDGRTLGETLLEPTKIYVPFIRACQEQGIPLRYAVNITGHGWRKLMRLNEPFVYRITEAPTLSPLFEFLIKEGDLSFREAYATFNMGAGFAVYVDSDDADRCVAVARAAGFEASIAGIVEKDGERKAVEISTHAISFEGNTLHVRG